MHYSRQEFISKINQQELSMAFIGMSNIGKSYLSKILAMDKNFTRIDVDFEIQKQLGFKTMQEIANWLGFPWQDNYDDRARQYLDLEAKISLKQYANEKNNIVLDTTGSVVHLDSVAINNIKNRYLVIYLKARKDDLAILKKRYFTHPKPTIWGEYFQNSHNFDNKTRLMKDYPKLLMARERLYQDMADIIIPASNFKDCQTPEAILKQISDAL